MGVDLTLMPLDSTCHQVYKSDREWKWYYSHTVLDIMRDRPLWDEIDEIPKISMTNEFQENFRSYLGTIPDGDLKGEHGYGKVTETPYGDPLEWVKAGDLSKVMSDYYGDEDDRPEMNIAAGLYLSALAPDTPVALYWS